MSRKAILNQLLTDLEPYQVNNPHVKQYFIKKPITVGKHYTEFELDWINFSGSSALIRIRAYFSDRIQIEIIGRDEQGGVLPDEKRIFGCLEDAQAFLVFALGLTDMTLAHQIPTVSSIYQSRTPKAIKTPKVSNAAPKAAKKPRVLKKKVTQTVKPNPSKKAVAKTSAALTNPAQNGITFTANGITINVTPQVAGQILSELQNQGVTPA